MTDDVLNKVGGYAGSLGRAVHWAKRKTSERGEILTEG